MYLFRKWALYAAYLYNRIHYRKQVKMIGFTVIYHDNKSDIRFNCTTPTKKVGFWSSSVSNMLGISQKCIVVARNGGHIEIGENTAVSGSTIYSMESIKIGKNVLVGVSCKIIDNDFHPLRPELRVPYNPDTIKKQAVEIGDNCFIGANSIILKGTKLGANCVVGAGSVVHGTWPDNSIIAGNPARFIRENLPQ